MKSDRYLHFSIGLDSFFRKYQSGLTFLFVLFCVFLADLFFSTFIPANKIPVLETFLKSQSRMIIDFAPEIWLTLLGLVLGTLIIVISIASQSTPKLIDLYISDQTSLLYVWFITSGSVHNLFLQIELVNNQAYKVNILLNTYVMLPIALLIAIPYVLYILRYTKTSNVIEKIFADNIVRLERLIHPANQSLLESNKTVAAYQHRLFESLNQLDDLLEYVSFKEPKGDVINKMGETIRSYIKIKDQINPTFFKISPSIRNDVSFKTMTGQFDDIEKERTFYEQKGYRLFGNAYLKLLDKDFFDLASLCASELASCGKTAIEQKDDPLINATIIRFNTFLRFGIKHGLRNGEARNLYNAIFHYSDFIKAMVHHRFLQHTKKSFFYLKIYVSEIYRHSLKEPSFAFLVDVFTWEMKKILVEVSKHELPISLQEELLDIFLQIDNLAGFEQDLDHKRRFNQNIRLFHIAMALYYLRVDKKSLVEAIIEDILEDHHYIGAEALGQDIIAICKRLESSSPTFWEDTDRGNSNLYFSEDKEFLPEFITMFNKHLNHALAYNPSNKLSAQDEESDKDGNTEE